VTDYLPVDCAFYARLELAILRREAVMLCWRDDAGVTHLERVRPTDLETRNSEEFLLFRTAAGSGGRARLDRIMEFRPAGQAARR